MSNFQNRIPRTTESDQQIADGVQRQRSLYCCADGCPNDWTVDGPEGKCCSAHAWKAKDQWKRISREQFDRQTERATMTPEQRYAEEHRLDFKESALASALGSLLQPQPGHVHVLGTGNRNWAYALKRCHEAGMKLTPFQIEAYKAVVARESIV